MSEDQKSGSGVPFGIQGQATKDGIMKTLTASKVQAFTIGGSSKINKFQKHKEEEAAKKKKEVEDAAKVYADFVSSFESDETSAPQLPSAAPIHRAAAKTWVRGGTVQTGPKPIVEAKDAFKLEDDDETDARIGLGGAGGPKSGAAPGFVRSGVSTSSNVSSGVSTNFSNSAVSGEVYRPQSRFVKASPFVKAGTLGAGDGVKIEKNEETKSSGAPPSSIRPSSQVVHSALPLPAPSSNTTTTGKKRALDSFRDELRREQEAREERLKQKGVTLKGDGMVLKAAFEDRVGSYDTGDPETTNLYVGNLNPQTTTEDSLARLFAVYGPIASVKVMWPRTHEEKERGRFSGFVSFMKREDAARALREMDGRDVGGMAVRVGWGKRIVIPEKPIFVLGQHSIAAGLPASASNLPTGVSPFGAELVAPRPGAFPPGAALPPPRLEVHVTRPSDPELAARIHRMVERVVKHGESFEREVMDRERRDSGNGKGDWAFLFVHDSPDHVYYRWKLYSILQGDPKGRWKSEPFQMFDEGAFWVPPEVPFDDQGSDSDVSNPESVSSLSSLTDEEDSSRRRAVTLHTRPLPINARRKLTRRLRKVTLTRIDVARAMLICIENAESADEVAQLLCTSLTLQSTPVWPTKLARLYVLSDVLHNSSCAAPNAWRYRAAFEGRLRPVMDHLGRIWKSIGSRLKAEQFRRSVAHCLEVWENWSVFGPETIEGLKTAFYSAETKGEDNRDTPEAFEAEQTKGVSQVALEDQRKAQIARIENEDDDVDGVPLNQLAPQVPINRWEQLGVEEVTSRGRLAENRIEVAGKEFERKTTEADLDDIDGVPLNIGAQNQISPMDVDDDIDGVPINIGPRTSGDNEFNGVGTSSNRKMMGDDEIDGMPLKTVAAPKPVISRGEREGQPSKKKRKMVKEDDEDIFA
ncbi:U2 snRNP-associated SURP domain-containing protein [Gonapodya sp. JEL0774]|nr:U2 snRNP-associated SURP domain-containing protein [Gonapodya sp. JEL0774]